MYRAKDEVPAQDPVFAINNKINILLHLENKQI